MSTNFIPPSRLAYFYEPEEEAESGAYTRIITEETTVELARTSQTEITGTPASVSVTFEAPEADKVSEYRLIFIAGANFGLVVTPPEGFSTLDVPEDFEEGVLYEISFVAINNYLICRVATSTPTTEEENEPVEP